MRGLARSLGVFAVVVVTLVAILDVYTFGAGAPAMPSQSLSRSRHGLDRPRGASLAPQQPAPFRGARAAVPFLPAARNRSRVWAHSSSRSQDGRLPCRCDIPYVCVSRLVPC